MILKKKNSRKKDQTKSKRKYRNARGERKL
jgi:hypothetical protein